MRIMITGDGLIGNNLAEKLMKSHDVLVVSKTKYSNRTYNVVEMNLCDVQKFKEVFLEFMPTHVVHTAALTNVDFCENNKDSAKKINFKATEEIAKICGDANVKLIYISTSFVFDGKKDSYSEEDKPNPINYYGETKYLGEQAVEQICKNFCIIRTDQPYGWTKEGIRDNFVTGTLKKMSITHQIEIFSDWFNHPTNVDNFSEAVTELLDKNGIFHVVGSEYLSRCDWAVKIADVFDKNNITVLSISSKKLALPAKRPNARLSIKKIESIIKTKMLNVQDGLALMKSGVHKT